MNKFKNNSKPLIWFMGLLLTAFIAGCGSDGGGSTQSGTLGISMTDAPACGFDAVKVTVSKVRVHQSSTADDKAAGWTDITLDPPRTINLLDLNDPTQAPNFALESLGEAPLEAGHYTQLRLVLVPNSGGPPFANSVIPSATKIEEPLVTPSAVQSGIKLIHQFTVDSGQRVDLLLDFDACKSIVQTGNGKYKLKPVIKVIPFVLNGIEGFVAPSLFVNQVNVNNAIVSAQLNGEIVRAAVPNATTGKFYLARLTAGVNYDVVITADSHATAVIGGVPVPSSTSTTVISTSGEPVTLNASTTTHSIGGTVTLNPADDDGTVVVAAKQSLSGGPTVTVKLQIAMLKTDTTSTVGDYGYNLLVLPAAAPSLGSYSTGLPLPIEFTQQPASVGGIYSIRGSAQTPTTVYTTQIPSPLSVDITGGNAIDQDFTLKH
jgi:hypothetical protein